MASAASDVSAMANTASAHDTVFDASP